MEEWKDARNHREPKWPLCGYAPGDYMGHCIRCDGRFMGMDKRAVHCFPCAIEVANISLEDQRVELRSARQENETLRAAIMIVGPLPAPSVNEE